MTFYITIKQLLNTQSLFIASEFPVRWGLKQQSGAKGIKKIVIIKSFDRAGQNLHFHLVKQSRLCIIHSAPQVSYMTGACPEWPQLLSLTGTELSAGSLNEAI